MGSGKINGFQINLWVLGKCVGSRDMYLFWRKVKILEECVDAREM
jgi:hypothetical protein